MLVHTCTCIVQSTVKDTRQRATLSAADTCSLSTHMMHRQWRQREFKVGGDEAPKGMSPFPPDPGEGSGRGNFFVISKWHILVTLRC